MSRPTSFDPSGIHVSDFYAQGVHFASPNSTVLASGQLGLHDDGFIPQDRLEEVQQAFANVAKVLEAGGASVRDLVKLTFLCVDFEYENMQTLIEPIVKFLQTTYGVTVRPTTTLIPVAKLAHPQAHFEVEAMAVLAGTSRAWSGSEQPQVTSQVQRLQCDVVVVGAGFSGIQAAADLQEAGLRVLVLEAKARIGGRSHSHKLNGGGIVELGAGYINKTTQPKIYELAQRFGLGVYRQYETGETVWQNAEGVAWHVPRDVVPKSPVKGQTFENDFEQLMAALDQEQEQVNIEKPSAASNHTDLSVEEWLQNREFSEWTKQQTRHFIAAVVGREAREVSLLYFLDYIKSGGGYHSLASEGEHGAQSCKIKQGTSAVAHGLARTLPAGSILLNSPVESIVQHVDGHCLTETKTGLTVQSSRVVVAIPTQTYDKIHFTPPLPPAKRSIVSRTKPAVYMKTILTYASPWWRRIGLVGSFLSVRGPINFSWDNSDDDTGKHYSLAMFSHGDSAAALYKLSSLERETAFLDHLVELVGTEHKEAVLNVVEITQKQWNNEEYILGGPTSVMIPGDYTKYGNALRTPFKHIHFAGSELAFEWKGYMEGALRSGSRCAAEVVMEIQGLSSVER